MSFTTIQQSMPYSGWGFDPEPFPQPTSEQLLQREIEDCLARISDLPEVPTKVIMDIGVSGEWFEIQTNQVALFMRLEELVEQLPEQSRRTIVKELHPSMSVVERNALKLLLEKGSKREGVVPRPLEVRKPVSLDLLKEEVDIQLMSKPLRVDGLVFRELTASDLAIRRRELNAAKAERAGVWPPPDDDEDDDAASTARKTSTESKRRRREIANKLAAAAKKLQAREALIDLSRVASPNLRDGLSVVKSATSALRAFADASPREVIVRRPSEAVVRPSGETVRRSEQSTGPGDQAARPRDQLRQSSDKSVQLRSPALPATNLLTTAAPRVISPKTASPLSLPPTTTLPQLAEEAGPSNKTRRSSERTLQPKSSVLSLRSFLLSESARTHSLKTNASRKPASPSPSAPPRLTKEALRPRSDPSAPSYTHPTGRSPTSCPWPANFLEAPLAAPQPPRSVSLPQPLGLPLAQSSFMSDIPRSVLESMSKGPKHPDSPTAAQERVDGQAPRTSSVPSSPLGQSSFIQDSPRSMSGVTTDDTKRPGGISTAQERIGAQPPSIPPFAPSSPFAQSSFTPSNTWRLIPDPLSIRTKHRGSFSAAGKALEGQPLQIPSAPSSPFIQQLAHRPDSPRSTSESTPEPIADRAKRHGSISAARQGIGDRIRQAREGSRRGGV